MADKKKILIAEDDNFISLAYKNGITRAGFDVITALNGVEAIDKIKTEKPDLVLLDLMMPIKGGFDVLEELKITGIVKKIPIIVLSNLGQTSDIEKCKE